MGQENEKYGQLFGSVDLLSEEHLELILSQMTEEHALYYLVESVKAAHKRNAFSIGETEVISKSIRVLSRVE
jgi:hypothetical protein